MGGPAGDMNSYATGTTEEGTVQTEETGTTETTKKEVKDVLFHCSKPVIINGEFVLNKKKQVIKEKPTHTLAFRKYDNDTVILGWAKAHSQADSYSKKVGRTIATERVTMLINRIEKYNNRKNTSIKDITSEQLPTNVLDNLDYFMSRAIEQMFDIDSKDSINIMFRSPSNEVYSYAVTTDKLKEIRDARINNIIEGEKNHNHTNAKYIFAITPDNEVVVQTRKSYYESGFMNELGAAETSTMDLMFTEEEGFTKIDPVKFQYNQKMTTLQLIRFMKKSGFDYDTNLEAQIVSK